MIGNEYSLFPKKLIHTLLQLLGQGASMKSAGVMIGILLVSLFVIPAVVVSEKLDVREDLSQLLDEEIDFLDSTVNETVVTEVTQKLLRSYFTENLGQVKNDDVLFYGRIPSGMIGFGVSRVYISLENTSKSIVMNFEGANQVVPSRGSLATHKSNYFLGDRGTFTDVASTDSVVYHELWSGIDLKYLATSSGAKYEFIVQPGADPNDVRFSYSNYDSLMVSHLSISVKCDERLFYDNGLVVKQGEQVINAEFIELEGGLIGVQVGEYDPDQTLIIDPLVYSTYFGGSDGDYITSVFSDGYGNVYAAGGTWSADFALVNPLDDTYSGTSSDGFIFKLNDIGNEILYSTYFGGSGSDVVSKIELDDSGSIYITGWTSSSDFPTQNAYQSSKAGSNDFYVLKLVPDGSAIVFSTYVGGSASDLGYEGTGTIDSSGNVYVSGRTHSTDFPIVNGYDSSQNGGSDCVVFKLASNGASLVFSTYIGGTGDDQIEGIAVDSEGNVYATGHTTSLDFPMMNPYDDTLDGSPSAFVFKMSSTGSSLLYSTYFGGSSDSRGYSITVDSSFCAYVTGETHSTDIPLVNPYRDTYVNTEGFLVKFNPAGNEILYSTYVGGSSGDHPKSVALDGLGNIIVGGEGDSTDIPLVDNVDTYTFGAELWIIRLNPDGDTVTFSTPMGGSHGETFYQVIADNFGNIIGCGVTYSDDFPLFNAIDSYKETGTISEPVLFKIQLWLDIDADGMHDFWEASNGFNNSDPSDALIDSDGDTLINLHEYTNGTNPWSADSDSDNLGDADEIILYGTDPNSADTDFDTMTDDWEVLNGTNPLVDDATSDPDSDLLSNLEEYLNSLDPLNNDTDFDLMPDGWEIFYGLNASLDDATNDPDSDTLTNLQEYQYGINPFESDSDFDDISDAEEIFVHGTDPANSDSDLDTLTDFDEIFTYGTNPLNNDSDSDIMDDAWELFYGLDPLNSTDASDDPDADGYTNLEEYYNGWNPLLDDSDNDGMPDDWEVTYGLNATWAGDASLDNDNDDLSNLDEYLNNCNPLNNDSDSDLMYDGWEVVNGLLPLSDDAGLDPDTDTLTNLEEFLAGSNPHSEDSDFDGLSDADEVRFFFSDPQDSASPALDNHPVYSTFLGGSGADYAESIVVDESCNMYAVGYTFSSDFPVFNPFDSTASGDYDIFAVKFDASGQILLYATYIGGIDYDIAYSAAVDKMGLLTIGGETRSSDFPLVNEIDATYQNTESYLLKLNATGNGLIFSTFIGGSSWDTIHKLTIDGNGTIYATGQTDSSDFPVVNAYDETWNGLSDSFVVKLSANGSSLEYSTFLGGSSGENGLAIAVDLEHNIIVSGVTTSEDFPIQNGYDSTFSGDTDIYVTKLSFNGSTIIFSTYLGGSSDDTPRSMGTSLDGKIYVTGYTYSVDFPLVNAINSVRRGYTDAFISCFEPLGNLSVATLIGGSDRDTAFSLKLDSTGNIYIAGETRSSDFPMMNPYDSTKSGTYDGFCLKLNNTCNGILYSTYFGGTSDEHIRDMDIDHYGRAYITGSVDSSSFPLYRAYDSTINGARDVFVLVLPNLGDADNDGLGNADEILHGTMPYDSDSDDDLMLDGWEVQYGLNATFNDAFDDFDSDGVLNIYELYNRTDPSNSDTDFDLLNDWDEIVVWLTNPLNPDTDFDGMIDSWEVSYSFDPLIDDGGEDVDSDNLTNLEEHDLGTNPLNNDTDSDSMPDGWEVLYLLDPLTYSAMFDADGEGLLDLEEYQHGTNPRDTDSDNDNLDDNSEVILGTNPLLADTDLDSMTDGWEVDNGCNPLVDDADDDNDLDSLTNLEEAYRGTQANNNDTDSDSLLDGIEVHIYGTNPLSLDTDNDEISDPDEIFLYGSDPTDPLSPGFDSSPSFSTQISGSDEDQSYSCVVDWTGFVYVAGFSFSTNFLIVDGLDVANNGARDCIIAKIDPDSGTLLYCTYIGGSDSDAGYAIEVDRFFNVYVAGYTQSIDFPLQNAQYTTRQIGYDAFALKLNIFGNRLEYSTYLAGNDNDYAMDLAIDAIGCAYVVGLTESSNFPMVNSFDSTFNGNLEGYIVKFDETGQVQYSSYLGGSFHDMAYGVDVDDSFRAYVVGKTDSSDFPTVSPIDEFNTDSAFVLRLSPDGSSLEYSTYLGGSSNDEALSVVVDTLDCAYIAGRTDSSNFPIQNAFDSSFNGARDIFLTKLTSSGDAIVFSTFFGGSLDEYCYGLDVDPFGNAYLTGYTNSNNYPTINAYDSVKSGSYDCFVLIFDSNGTARYSTFIGGSNDDLGQSIKVDMYGRIVFTGWTHSIDYPLVNNFDDWASDSNFIVTVMPNILDLDSDGLTDEYEIAYGTHPLNTDTDNDLMFDGWELQYGYNPLLNDSYNDDDLDGLLNYEEFLAMTLPYSNDTDQDSMPDGWEVSMGLDPHFNDAALDLDLDNLINLLEFQYGLAANNEDTDLDLMPDGWEVAYGLNPLLDDSTGDLDLDGLSNLEEFTLATYPNDSDSEDDGMEDGWEVQYSLNPLVNDAFNDEDDDELPNLEEFIYGTNPLVSDTDFDTMPDGWEVQYGLDPTFDDANDDLDLDGLSNVEEYQNGCNPSNGDTDTDLLGDLEEIDTYGTNPLVDDTDRDLLEDGYEVLTLGTSPLLTDSDNDSLTDGFEVLQFGSDPTLFDTDSDGMSDYEEYLAGTDPLVADANDDEDGDGLSNIEEWNLGTDIFDMDSDSDGVSDFDEIQSGRNPLWYDVPLPIGELTVIGILIVGSIIPALGVVLLNERMFIRMTRKPRTVKEEEVEYLEEEE